MGVNSIFIQFIYPQRACVRQLQYSVCLSVSRSVILSHDSGSLKTVASCRLKDASKCCTLMCHNSLLCRIHGGITS